MQLSVIAYEGISPFMLSTPITVFAEPFLAAGHTVATYAQDARVTASGGIELAGLNPLEQAAGADVVILPGWCAASEPVPKPILDVLRAAADRSAIVVGLCLGAFGLAEAGLLNGLRATTHWARVAEFSARFPRVQLDPGALFVDEEQVLTSAGMAAGLDCCLHLLARFSGQAEANRIARHLVLAPQRSGDRPQLIARPVPASSSEQRVAALLEALADDPTKVPRLDDLARKAGMSPRSLTRHIRAQTGDHLSGWLRRARLARAQDLLMTGGRLEQIATGAGFADAQALRAAFRLELGLTPRQWLMRQQLG